MEDLIRAEMRHRELTIEYVRSVGSTNTVLKELAARGAPEGLVLVAESQTGGRGRLGRSFYSPGGSGLYMSMLLRPRLRPAEAVSLTACAALAAAEGIEYVSGRPAGIKWVNDIVMDGLKVCGILTESAVESGSGLLSHAVIGIGINLAPPPGGFPKELEGIAGTVFPSAVTDELRCRLAGRILDLLADYSSAPGSDSVFDGYLRRSVVPGRKINLISPDGSAESADAIGINRDFSLLVRRADGRISSVSSGEVSLRLRP